MCKNRKTALVSIVILVTLFIAVSPASAEGMGSIDTEIITSPVQEPTSHEAMLYAMAPDHLYPFIYDGTPPSTWREIDTNDCVVGRLYVYDENTQDVTPIGDQIVTTHASNQDHLYYVTSDNLIVQADYSGSCFEAIYLAKLGDITMMNTFGDYLYFVEGGTRVIVLDIPDQTVYATISGDSVMSAYMFDADKLIWYDNEGNATYYNITAKTSTLIADQNAETELIAHYIAPETVDGSVVIQSSIVVDYIGYPDSYNDIAFPLAKYKAVPERKGYKPTDVLSYFKDENGVGLKYARAGQCDGFAKFAHDTFWHLADWSRTAPSWQYSSDYHGEGYTWASQDKMIDFFEGLSRGSFVRYTSKKDYADGAQYGSHSYFFDGIDPDGLGTWHYECNQDWENGVGYQYYTFALYYSKNQFVYEYVEHTLSTSYVAYGLDRHRVDCTGSNCDGYLLQLHTGTPIYTQSTEGYHTLRYTCCSGTIQHAHKFSSGVIPRCTLCGYTRSGGDLEIPIESILDPGMVETFGE